MLKFIDKYRIQIKLICALFIGVIGVTLALYFLIPFILNYPNGTYGTNFQTELENTVYWQQVVLISFSICLIFAITIIIKTNFLIKHYDVIKHPEKHSHKEINFVKEKLYNVPYSIFILNLIIPSIALTVIHAFTIQQLSITTLKMFIIVFSFVTLFVTGIFIYNNNLFKDILSHLPATNNDKIKRSSITKRMLYHTVPIIVASLLFVTLLGYVKVANEKGNSYFETYNKSLHYYCTYNNNKFNNLTELTNSIKTDFELIEPNDLFFIKLPDGSFVDKDLNPIKFSNFFIKYLNELSSSNNGRVYEYYGNDMQAATNTINIAGQEYLIGIYFKILSSDVLEYFLIAYIVIVIIDIIILLLFSNSFKYDINIISERFSEISNLTQTNEQKELIVTSNDEIGDLCTAYNKIQKLTHDNQNTLIERERLASLGQMVGGIAHNLKTPIFSISGGLEGLSDLIKEYDESIEDPNVTDQDMHDIAKDMREWITKLKGHTSYMSDVITAVKGQAVNLSEEQAIDFTIEELFQHIKILMQPEVKHSLSTLNLTNNVDNIYQITGSINSLVQVINNLISNAIQSYEGTQKDKIIDLSAKYDDASHSIIISVKDYGPGLPDNVKQKLFKEMITTKGKDGTGLGLFMSYSNIKAHFKGDLTFETEKNKGTTFFIKIPI